MTHPDGGWDSKNESRRDGDKDYGCGIGGERCGVWDGDTQV